MKKVILFALLSTLAMPALSRAQQAAAAQAREHASKGPAPAAKKLSRAEFDTLLKNPAGVIVLDVRRPDEIQSIGGFPAYLSIQAGDLEKNLAYIPKDRAIVPVSNRANRALRAAGVLEQHAFTVAGVIGAQDYEGEGGTLVKIAPPAPGTESSK